MYFSIGNTFESYMGTLGEKSLKKSVKKHILKYFFLFFIYLNQRSISAINMWRIKL